jgi:hypothetical protein
MLQLFDATFHSTGGELELMMRISDNITTGGKEEGRLRSYPSTGNKRVLLSSLNCPFLFYLGVVMFISYFSCFFSSRVFFLQFLNLHSFLIYSVPYSILKKYKNFLGLLFSLLLLQKIPSYPASLFVFLLFTKLMFFFLI